MNKHAETFFEIHDLLKSRWSPRAYADQPVEAEKLGSLFEAARWSPSASNLQPWSFIVAIKGEGDTHEKLVAAASGNNQLWAGSAPILVLAIAQIDPEKPHYHRYAYYDLGQSVAHLSVQASALGLHVHQMGGFDAAKAGQIAEVPAGYEAITLIAIGYYGDANVLPDPLRERELAPRTRKPLSEVVFQESWNNPLHADSAVETQLA